MPSPTFLFTRQYKANSDLLSVYSNFTLYAAYLVIFLLIFFSRSKLCVPNHSCNSLSLNVKEKTRFGFLFCTHHLFVYVDSIGSLVCRRNNGNCISFTRFTGFPFL
eukprot:713564_1